MSAYYSLHAVHPLRRTKARLATLRENYWVADKDIGVAFRSRASGLGYLLTLAFWGELGWSRSFSRA